MSESVTRKEVLAQAEDGSIINTDPVVAKAAVVGVATSILIALGAFGLISEDQRTIIIEQIGNVTYGLFVILPLAVALVSAIWGKLSAFAPRTAARIAVLNTDAAFAAGKAGDAKPAPTLLPPP